MKISSFPPLLQRFINYSRTIRGLSEKTLRSYSDDIMLFFRYILMQEHEFKHLENVTTERVKAEMTDEKIVSVDRDTILAFLFFLDEDRSSSVATRKRRLAGLNNFYKYINNEEYRMCGKSKEPLLDTIPTENIPSIRLEKREPVYLTLEEIDILMATTQKNSHFPERDICILTFFFHLGLRREELSKIDLPDIKKDEIHIIGKGNKERIIPLDAACKKALKAYLPTRITPDPDNPKDVNALFISRNHNRMSLDAIYTMVKKMSRLAGLSNKISPHPLRHTFATLMLTDSDDIVSLQSIMGHSSISTTEKYVHLGSAKHISMINNNPLNREEQFSIKVIDSEN